jgi:hypothetical protein
MGWGTSEHEGYSDEKRADGTWSGPSHRSSDPPPVAYRAQCSCGWHSDREHQVPTRPAARCRGPPGVLARKGRGGMPDLSVSC